MKETNMAPKKQNTPTDIFVDGDIEHKQKLDDKTSDEKNSL